MKLIIKSCNFQFSCLIKSITLNAENGIITVLPKHEPYLASIKNSLVIVQMEESEQKKFFIYSGAAYIIQTEVKIYADLAQIISENAIENAKKSIDELNEKLLSLKKPDNVKEEEYKFYISYFTAMKKAIRATPHSLKI